MANTTTYTHGGIADRISGFRNDMNARVSTYRTYRSTLHELRGLSTRELNDLGLSRGDLRQVAWNAAAK